MHIVCSAENFMRGLLVVNGGLLTPKFSEIASLWKQAFARAGIGLDERDNISLATETEDAFRRYDFCLFYDKDVLLCRRIEGHRGMGMPPGKNRKNTGRSVFMTTACCLP